MRGVALDEDEDREIKTQSSTHWVGQLSGAIRWTAPRRSILFQGWAIEEPKAGGTGSRSLVQIRPIRQRERWCD